MTIIDVLGCVEIANLCLESCNGGGVYMNAHASGVNIDLRNIWNYDVKKDSIAIQVEAGRCVNINNVLASDRPSHIVLSPDVDGVSINNVFKPAGIDARGARNVVAFNAGPVENAGPGSIVNGIRVG